MVCLTLWKSNQAKPWLILGTSLMLFINISDLVLSSLFTSEGNLLPCSPVIYKDRLPVLTSYIIHCFFLILFWKGGHATRAHRILLALHSIIIPGRRRIIHVGCRVLNPGQLAARQLSYLIYIQFNKILI